LTPFQYFAYNVLNDPTIPRSPLEALYSRPGRGVPLPPLGMCGCFASKAARSARLQLRLEAYLLEVSLSLPPPPPPVRFSVCPDLTVRLRLWHRVC
jgi:hypothetical protein